MKAEWKLAPAIAFGMLWGLDWGLVFLAPGIIRTHNMAGTPAEAMKMIAVMAAIFAFLGAGIAAGLFVIAWIVRRVAPAPWLRVAPALSITTAVLLPAIYIALGATIYFWKFRTIGGAAWYQRAALLAIVVTSAAALMGAAYARLTSRSEESDRKRILSTGTGVVALAAALTMVFRFPSPDRQVSKAYPLHRIADSAREKRKLIVIGIDGGTWHVISPLIKQGRLPTFDSMMRSGVHGDVQALWPPYWSIAAWGAIVTGHRRRDVGVFGDVQVKIPGLPVFQSPMDLEPRQLPITAIEYGLASKNMIRPEIPGRESLSVPPVWEFLDRSGIETAVIRFNFTHPATGQAAFVVSNLAMADMWGKVGVHSPDKSTLAEPASRRDELLAPFSPQWKWDSTEFARILPDRNWPKPHDATFDPVSILRDALRFDQATVTSASHLMEIEPSIEVLFVHFGGVDSIEHTFWQYRFPEEFKHKPAHADVVAIGPVVDRYLEFVDKGIATLIASFPERPNVLIVSDHGQAAREDGVPFKGWHASPGIFLASGPDIVPRSRTLDVSYFDIVPTILDLKGLEKPRELRGKALLELHLLSKL